MGTRTLELEAWGAYLDRVSRALGARLAEVEVAALDLGDQVEGNWIPLQGIAYDRRDDLVEVALEGVDHRVRHPRELHVEEDPAETVRSMEIVDAEGRRHILRLKAPLALPPPA